MEQIIDALPADVFPAPGENWGEVNAKLANDWLAEHFAGKVVTLSGYPTTAAPHEREGKTDSIMVDMHYLARYDRLTGVDQPGQIVARGFRWGPVLTVWFESSEAKSIARIRKWDGAKHGDRISFGGTIDRIMVDPSGSPNFLGIRVVVRNATLNH